MKWIAWSAFPFWLLRYDVSLDNLTRIIDCNPMCILKRPSEKRHCFQWTLHLPDVTELAEILADLHHCYMCIYPIVNFTSPTQVFPLHVTFVVSSQVTGFFKGLSFPLASITLYNSMVFGCFSNTQRLISRYRYGDGRHPSSILDMTAASMLTGLVSVGVGAPVDLVKIRLQMQTQHVLAGKPKILCWESQIRSSLGLFFVKLTPSHKKTLGNHYRKLLTVWFHATDSLPSKWTTAKWYKSRSRKLYVFSENFNIAGNGSMPLRSVGLRAQTMSRGPIHCISTILQNEGIQGLYRGAGAMILRDIPGYTLYFIPYTLLCNWLNPKRNGSPHPCTIWLAGGLAGKLVEWDLVHITPSSGQEWPKNILSSCHLQLICFMLCVGVT